MPTPFLMQLRYKDKIRSHRAVNPALANIPLLPSIMKSLALFLFSETTLTDAPHMEHSFLSEFGRM